MSAEQSDIRVIGNSKAIVSDLGSRDRKGKTFFA